MVRSRPWLVLVLLVLSVCLPLHCGLCADEVKVSFVDSQPAIIFVEQPTTAATVALLNNGQIAVDVDFFVLLRSDEYGSYEKHAVSSVNSDNITASRVSIRQGTIQDVRLQFGAVKARAEGYLMAQTDNRVVAFRALRFNATADGCWSWLPLAAGVVVAAIVVAWAEIQLRKKAIALSTRMGTAKWDFSSSWASNLTVVGALLTTTAAISALPDQTELLSKSGYAVLGLMFALLTGLAPLTYNVTRSRSAGLARSPGATVDVPAPAKTTTDADRRENPPADNEQPPPPQDLLQGTVGSFLVASLLTLTATVGQLLVDCLLLIELGIAHRAVKAVIIIAFLALLLLAIALIISVGKTIYWTAMDQSKQYTADPMTESIVNIVQRATYSNSFNYTRAADPQKRLPRREFAMP